MKTYQYLSRLFALLFLVSSSVLAQELGLNPESPTVSGLSGFESNPIDLSTGLPDISIPIYKMPTLSKDITVPITLSYHPSSVAAYDSLSGNCGRGWTLNNGGMIYRKMENRLKNDSIANQAGIYHFNFRQYSGQFSLTYDLVNGWEAEISENSGTMLLIKVNVFDGDIESFSIYDDYGYSFIFTAIDKYTYSNKVFDYQFEPPEFKISQKSAYHLGRIVDPGGVTLVTYQYDTNHPAENYLSPPGTGSQKQLSSINVEGYGSISLGIDLGVDEMFKRYSDITIKDIHENVIKKFEFNYNDNMLTQVNEGDEYMTNVLSHKLYYKHNPPYPSSMILDTDAWGFYNLSDKSAFSKEHRIHTRQPSETMAKKNVLEKIELPTGGCIIYDYELNTFSTFRGRDLDLVYNYVTEEDEEDPDYFTRLNSENIHNFTFTPLTLNHVSSNLWELEITGGPKTVCLYVDAEPVEAELEEGNPMLYYPDGHVSGNDPFGNLHNAENGSHGKSYTLANGTYYLSLSHPSDSTPEGNIYASVATLVGQPLMERRGNGIRIKKTGYFDDGAVPQDYFSNPTTDIPDRLVSYGYNFHERPERSSGSNDEAGVVWEWDNQIAYNSVQKRCPPVIYKNVTVIDTNVPGKVVYDFTSPIDAPRIGNNYDTFAFKKPLHVTAYNTVGDTIRSTAYTYTSHVLYTIPPRMELPDTGLAADGWNSAQ